MGDLRHAARLLLKAPGFSGTAVLILALAIAGNTATFSAVNVFLIEPLPFADADRLVVVSMRHRATAARAGVSYADYQAWSAHAATIEAAAAVRLEQSFNLSGGAEPIRVTGGRMTASLLPVLGVSPLRGRRLLPQDERPGAPGAVLITERFWERRFNRAETAIGSALVVDGAPSTIVGVLPADFRLLYGGYSIWAPLVSPRDAGSRSQILIGRLAPGATPQRSAAELSGLAEAAGRDAPAGARGWQPRVLGMRDFVLAGRQRTLLFVITALALLLLVACANTASLQLARAAARRQEIATRLALGATRPQVIRQLLAEAAIIAAASAAVALVLVALARKLLLAGSPDLRELQISLPVLGFTLLLTLVTTIAFGLVPALTGTRMELASVLTGAFTPKRATRRLLSALVVLEIASSVVLLVPAALLFRSFLTLRQMNPGFVVDGVLTFSVTLPEATYPDAQRRRAFHADALDRLGAMAGARAVAASDALPLEAPATRPVEIAGTGRTIDALARTVSTDYFRALAIPLRAGRSFGRADGPEGARVAVVNETLAKAAHPDGHALGAVIRLGDEGLVTIVGVAADLRSVGLRVPPQPEVMLPLSQHPAARVSFAVATGGDPGRLVVPAREAMRALDADLPLGSIRPMTETMDEQVAAVRVIATLLAALAMLALVLASAGLSGLMSRLVSQRTREFGVRAALGATRRDVVVLVMRDAVSLVAWGLALGLPAAAAVARVAASMLWGVSAADVQAFAAVPLALALTTCAACYVPARRAAHLDPAVALRAS